MGKTALALQASLNAAIVLRVPTLFISLEMGSLDLVDRLLSWLGRIPGHFFRQPRYLTAAHMTRLGEAGNTLRQTPIFIDDSASRTVFQVTAQARLNRLTHRIGLVVVDYLQLIDHHDPSERVSRQEQVSQISRRLKALAKELEIPVLALSQLNRQSENRDGHRPRLSDLRESGALEQDADLVLLLHRPEYYDPNDQQGVCEVNVAKNRNGPTGTVKVMFRAEFTRFENLEEVNQVF
jgi:replicative DNA helicase